MMSRHILFMGIAAVAAGGCSSEVDKCVDSYLRAYDREWSEESKARTPRDTYAANMRLICLRATAKNE